MIKEAKKESLGMILLVAALTAVASGVGQLIVDEIKEWRDKKKKKEQEVKKPAKKK